MKRQFKGVCILRFQIWYDDKQANACSSCYVDKQNFMSTFEF
jgi:hypothetical protein